MEEIAQSARVYLDTNVLIYLTEGTVAQKAALRGLFLSFDARAARYFTSELAYTETLVHPIRTGKAELIQAYEHLLTQVVEALPLTREVLCLAAKLRAQTPSQRTSDALHVATAIVAGANVFVTGDRGIRNVPATMLLKVV